ncbi:unnamed protein product [Cuscuta epithymum]|uniref:Uncharacterized protein n=1 Tax=Cuscuta epithymum TaxID=186058 RepID=A0AAV0E1Y7_9ASTE|nr:unnamed protein product [Cuscuta epithymum]
MATSEFQKQINGEQKDKDEWVMDDEEEEAAESEDYRFGASTIVAMVRPPPEPPPRVERGARVQEIYFACFVFFIFRFGHHGLLFTSAIIHVKTLEHKSSDDESSLPVIGSCKPNSR